MSSRIAIAVTILAAIGARQTDAQAPPPYANNFGDAAPIVATGNQVVATDFGWEPSTVFGHEIYALTNAQYTSDLSAGCFGFSAPSRASCQGGGGTDLGALQGLPLFNKPYGVTCPGPNVFPAPCIGGPQTTTFGWTAGTEIIFALMVDQGPDPALGTDDFNWFFSGDPSRNSSDDLAHLGFFSPGVFPNGVPDDDGVNVGQQAPGTYLFGFEDVTRQFSDWDFDNAIFNVEANTIGVPESVIPEPATLTLLGAGLVGLGAFGRRGRRRTSRQA